MDGDIMQQELIINQMELNKRYRLCDLATLVFNKKIDSTMLEYQKVQKAMRRINKPKRFIRICTGKDIQYIKIKPIHI